MTLQTQYLPTVVMLDGTTIFDQDIATNTIYNTTDSGIVDIFTEFSLYDADNSDLIDVDTEAVYSPVYNDSINTINEVVTDLLNDFKIDSPVYITVSPRDGVTKDSFKVVLWISSGKHHKEDDTIVTFRVNIGRIPATYDTEVEMYISGTKFYSYDTDLYCSSATTSVTDVSIEQGLGRISSLYTDLISCVFDIDNLSTDVYSTIMGISPPSFIMHCCTYSGITCSGIVYPGGYFCAATYSGLLDLCSTYSGCVYDCLDYYTNTCSGGLPIDVEVLSGGIAQVNTDIFNSKLGTIGGIGTDFKTKSLFIGDFFIDDSMFTTASSTAWVDIVDYLYPVDVDKTKLYIDDVVASGIYFEDIPNGKRMCYDPENDFYSTGGVTYFIHSESSIGEVEEKEFYLLYGYDLKINEIIRWPVNTRVVVRAEASNLTFCSNLESEVFDFTTVDWPSVNLGCTILPVGFVDLPVGISPQSTAFFYGKTYTVKIQGVKDFSGNIMPDIEYCFTIEDLLK